MLLKFMLMAAKPTKCIKKELKASAYGVFMDNIALEFPNDQTYETWKQMVNSILKEYDPRAYQCVYVRKDSEGASKAIQIAYDLGAKKKY
ncbi:MAG: hypothetical protein H7328_07940 [Bdellovibrio sp.]|nr:hypothetical protein [Bdellovibrio sp.]